MCIKPISDYITQIYSWENACREVSYFMLHVIAPAVFASSYDEAPVCGWFSINTCEKYYSFFHLIQNQSISFNLQSVLFYHEELANKKRKISFKYRLFILSMHLCQPLFLYQFVGLLHKK